MNAFESVFVVVFHEGVLEGCCELTDVSFVVQQTVKRSIAQLIRLHHRDENEFVIGRIAGLLKLQVDWKDKAVGISSQE